MTKVSSGKPKKGPPAHQNSYSFHHNKSSKLTKHITSLPIRFLCPACVAVIEWRKKYRKYKPLTVVKKCTACGEKKIKDAYHVICGDCVRLTSKCGKCLLPQAQWINEGTAVEIDESGEIKRALVGSVKVKEQDTSFDSESISDCDSAEDFDSDAAEDFDSEAAEDFDSSEESN